MNVVIHNYRSIQRAAFPLGGVVLIAGPNEAGKSSIAMAVSCALRGVAVPDGMLKKHANQLIRDGEDKAVVELDNNMIQITPSKHSFDGAAMATGIATGNVSYLDLDERGRASYLSERIFKLGKSGATVDRFHAAMADIGYGEKAVAKLWQEIKASPSGWDDCHRRCKEYVTKQKGAWEEVTREKWGVRKAEQYGSDVEGDADQLTAQVRQLEAEVNVAQVQEAAKAQNIEELRTLALSVDPMEKKLKGLEADVQAKRAAWNEANMVQIPVPEDPGDPLACPSCGTVLALEGGKLTDDVKLPKRPSEEEVAAAKQKAKEHAAKVAELLAAFESAKREEQGAHEELVAARRARLQVQEFDNARGQAGDLDTLRDKLEEARAAADAARKRDRATAIQRDIAINMALTQLLSPEGLRRQALVEGLAGLNEQLRDLSAAAGWPTVAIRDDLSVMYGTRPVELASASGRYRASAVLQVAFANEDGSQAVVLDAADILDAKGRNGLFGMLQRQELPVLVCMTMNKATQVPDLGAAGIGASYWLQDGTLVEVGQFNREAA